MPPILIPWSVTFFMTTFTVTGDPTLAASWAKLIASEKPGSPQRPGAPPMTPVRLLPVSFLTELSLLPY